MQFRLCRYTCRRKKMVCQAAADTYNSALQLKSIRYDLKTEKAYLAGMDKNVPESFLNIPPDKRSAEICLQAEKWYPELLKKQPELIPRYCQKQL